MISDATKPVPASTPVKLTDTKKKSHEDVAQIGSEAKAPQQSAPQATGTRRGSVVNLVV